MNIDDLKSAEDTRLSAQEEKQKLEIQLKNLLTEEQSLWKKADVLYNKFKEILKQEFIKLFKEKGFTPNLKTNFVEMTYKEKSISFESANDCSVTFFITNRFEEPSYGYSFTIEPENLNLKRSSMAYLYNGQINSISEIGLYEDIKNLSEYINQLKIKLNDLDNWELKIAPFDDTIHALGNVKYSNIEEVINAILNRKR